MSEPERPDRLDLDFRTAPAPSGMLDSVRARARRRRRGQILGAVVVVALAVAVPLTVSDRHGDDGQDRLAGPPPSASSAPQPSAGAPAATPSPSDLQRDKGPTPSVHTAPSPGAGASGSSRPVVSDAAYPSTLIAFTPGGDERPTVIDTASLQTLRVLASGSQTAGAGLSADRQTLYLPDPEVAAGRCGNDWWAVDVATGTHQVLPSLTGLVSVVPSPDGTGFAVVADADGCSRPGDAHPEVLSVRRWDGTVVRSTALPTGNWFVEAWSPQGGTLLLSDRRPRGDQWQVRRVDDLAEVATVPAAPTGCVQGTATLRADHDVVIARTCASGALSTVRLDDVDPVTGQQISTVSVVTTQGDPLDAVANPVTLDADAQWALVSVSTTSGSRQGELYAASTSGARRVGLTGVFGALW